MAHPVNPPMKHDARSASAAQRRLLAEIMPDEDAKPYVRNRNDYEGFNIGRDNVDQALVEAAGALADQVHRPYARTDDTVFERASRAAYTTRRVGRSDGPSWTDAQQALVDLADALTRAAERAKTLAEIAAMRADDAAADKALDRFVDALRGTGAR
jgi:hypothetical protein